MADVSRRIARWRVTAGFATGIVALVLARPTPRWLAIGSAVACAGEAFRIWAAGHLEKGREVTSSGPYRLTRHPLYLGSTVMGIGLALGSGSLVVAAAVIVYLAVTLTAAVRTEESHLTEKFGGAYPAYREGRVEGTPRRFSLERAIRNREQRALIGVVLVLALLLWKAGQP